MQPVIANIEYRSFRRGVLKNVGGVQTPAMLRQGSRLGARENPAPMDCLDSWKEIAVHLKRTVRTVQRWERYEGLPVHRHLHARASSVYASKSEIDAWWNRESVQLERRVPGVCGQTTSGTEAMSRNSSIVRRNIGPGRSRTLPFTSRHNYTPEITTIEICHIDEMSGRVTPLLQFQVCIAKCPVRASRSGDE